MAGRAGPSTTPTICARTADGLKVGGHQASSASLATIMTALYFRRAAPAGPRRGQAARLADLPRHPVSARQPDPREARELPRLQGRRAIRRAPRTPTTSISRPARSGLGVAQTLFSSLVQDYVRAHGWGSNAPKAAWWRWSATPSWTKATSSRRCSKAGSRACAIAGGSSTTTARASTPWCAKACGSATRQLFKNFGWDVVILKYGSLQQAAFREPGGETLRPWIDNCPNQLYSALVFQGGAAWRKRLLDEIGDQGDVDAADRRKRSDDELAAADEQSRRSRPAGAARCVRMVRITTGRPASSAYTVKGFGLPFAGHKDNHAGLMTPAQMETFRPRWTCGPARMGQVRGPGRGSRQAASLPRQGAVRRQENPPPGPRPRFAVPAELPITDSADDVDARPASAPCLNEIGRGDSAFADAHRHHVAGRDGVDQSRPVGEPPRAVRCEPR